MTTLPGPERVDKLRRIVEGMRAVRPATNDQEVFNDLLAVLDALPALRAENEKLKAHNELLWTMESEAVKSATARAEKAEAVAEQLSQALSARDYQYKKAEAKLAALKADTERLKKLKWSDVQDSVKRLADTFLARAKKAEAELAAARPLLEAVMGADDTALEQVQMYDMFGDAHAILRAALDYRENHEHKK